MARKENPVPAGDVDSLPLGSRMRQARQSRGTSLGILADLLGYSKAHLSAVENRTVKPSRELVAGYERELSLPVGQLLAAYDLQTAMTSEQPGRANAGAAGRSLDAEIARIMASHDLASTESDLIRKLLLEEARNKSAQVRATIDWWSTPGPVPICCIPMAGWQWREWSREQIVAAIDRAAAEAMAARIRELVVIVPPAEVTAMEMALAGPAFAKRMQKIHCVAQSEARGLGHAILQARTIIDERPFAVLLPDNHFDRPGAEGGVLQQLVEQYNNGGSSVLAVAKLKINRRNYGLARLRPVSQDRGFRAIDLLAEKPGAEHPLSCNEPSCDPESICAVLGRYVLSPSVMNALSLLNRHRRKESSLELVDALQWLIDRRGEAVAGWELPSLVQLGRDETLFVASYPSTGEKPVATFAA
jgi:dTDP-glucose pyrophosphorylase/transcriptional regulator with XRE-family HTH domain